LTFHPSNAGDSSPKFVDKRQSQHSINDESDPSQALIAQKEEILSLWRDPEVRRILSKRNVQLEEKAGL